MSEERQGQEARKPSSSEDNFELKAMNAVGDMEGGVAVFGSGAEVNLDWQVLFRVHLMKPFSPYSL